MSDQTAGPGGGSGEEPADPFDIVLDEDFVRAAKIKESEARGAAAEARYRELEAEHEQQRRADRPRPLLRQTDQRDPVDQQERRRGLVIAAISVAVVAAIGLPRLFGGHTGTATASPTTATSKNAGSAVGAPVLVSTPTAGSMTVITPSLDPSRAALVDKPWPPITSTIAFPDQTVKLGPNLTVEQVETTTQVPCDSFSSSQMATLIDQGAGCSQLLTALYTTSDYKAQFTIDVLTMNKAEDAASIVAMAKTMPMTYQMGSMDPPPGSLVPTVPVGNGGVTECIMAVRSVVFVNAQWLAPGDQDSTLLTADGSSLLQYVDAKVSAYEQKQVDAPPTS